MSTHAAIGLLNPDGSIDFIYRQHDGHPEETGDLLRSHYSNRSSVSELITLGTVDADIALSELQARRDGYEATHFNTEVYDLLVSQNPARHHANDLKQYQEMALKMHVHYMYLLDDEHWTVSEKRRLSPKHPWILAEPTPLEEWLQPRQISST